MTITRSGLLHCVLLTVALAGCEGRDKSTADSAAPPAAGFTVGGTLTGLASGESVVLKVNGVDPQTVSAGGKFMFSSGIAANGSYSVTVATAPVGQTCTVTGGQGTVTATSVANIMVTCSDETFSLGGTISGLGARSGLILKNGTDSRTVAANATSFVMPTPVSFDSTFAVAVQSAPSGLTCTISRGAGTMPAGNVSNVAVTCIVQTHTVGGSVSGLTTAGLVLANGSDTFAVAANATSFTMPTSVATGSNYNVTVKVHPPLESCSVTNGAGPMAGANITNVAIACTPGMVETVLHSFAAVDAEEPYYSHLLLASDGNFYGLAESGGTNNYGAIFKITPAGVETVLWNFGNGSDGYEPYGSLIQGTDGNLYGMTEEGGVNNNGTVFKITLAGVETVLYSFGGGIDAQEPYGSLVQGSDGNFYGMTESGGANDEGAVVKITPAGAETVLWSFGTGTDGYGPYGNLIQGIDGNFYGLTYGGGTAGGDGTVFKITTAGTETVLYSFAGGTDGEEPYGSLVQDSNGNFYGITYAGGTNSAGVAFKVTPAGAETVLWSFGGGTDGSYPTGSLTLGNDGNFYGLANSGGTNGEGTIFQITPSGIETVLYSFSGPPSDGRYPDGDVSFGPDGTLYGDTNGGGASGLGIVFSFN